MFGSDVIPIAKSSLLNQVSNPDMDYIIVLDHMAQGEQLKYEITQALVHSNCALPQNPF